MVAVVAGGCGRVAFDALGSTVTGDGAISDGVSGDGAAQFNCANRETITHYSFSASLEGWMFKPNAGYTGSAQWSSQSIGDPGSIEVAVTSGSGATLLGWLYAPMPVGDLSSRYSAIWILTTSTGVQIKHYARNASGDWADGGSVSLMPNVWTCITLDLATPAFNTPAFDSGNVDELGVTIEGTAPITAWADGPGY